MRPRFGSWLAAARIDDDDSAPITTLAESIPGVREIVGSYDETGQPQSVSFTWVDGETVTVTDPTAVTALAGR